MNERTRKNSFSAAVVACAFFFTGCTTSSDSTTPDPPPVEEPPPPAEPTATPPPTETKVDAPPPEQAEEPKPVSAKKRYTGMPVVLTKVERTTITCAGKSEGASADDNRRACVRELQAQVSDASNVIVVVDEMLGQGCPNCLTMTADVSPVAHPGEHPPVLFAKQNAGTVECTAGEDSKTLADTRKECYGILRREAGALRAGVVLPMGIEEGKPCKSCIGVVGTGFTAEVLP